MFMRCNAKPYCCYSGLSDGVTITAKKCTKNQNVSLSRWKQTNLLSSCKLTAANVNFTCKLTHTRRHKYASKHTQMFLISAQIIGLQGPCYPVLFLHAAQKAEAPASHGARASPWWKAWHLSDGTSTHTHIAIMNYKYIPIIGKWYNKAFEITFHNHFCELQWCSSVARHLQQVWAVKISATI